MKKFRKVEIHQTGFSVVRKKLWPGVALRKEPCLLCRENQQSIIKAAISSPECMRKAEFLQGSEGKNCETA